MQTLFTFATEKRLPEILCRLQAVYGKTRRGESDPLSQLVFCVVGEKTPGALALASFHRLRQEFARWSDIRDADPDDLIPSLRGVADHARKAKLLPQILRQIEARHGLLELDFLADWPIEAAQKWLQGLPGIRAAAAAATLSFSSLRKTILSVDHDSARPLRRMALVPAGAPLSALDRYIGENLPFQWKAREARSLHDGLARLGRNICHQGRPDCKHCPLNDLCPTAKHGSAKVLNFPQKKYVGKARKIVREISKGGAEKAGVKSDQ